MNSTFRLHHVHEPLLEFGSGGRHQDVRFGLIDHGPVDFSVQATRTVRVGVIGSSETVDGFREWFARCEGEIPAKPNRQPNLFPAFPGSGINGPFRCWFEIDGHQRILRPARLSKITGEERDDVAIRMKLSHGVGRDGDTRSLVTRLLAPRASEPRRTWDAVLSPQRLDALAHAVGVWPFAPMRVAAW